MRGELLFVKIDGTTNEAPAVFPQMQESSKSRYELQCTFRSRKSNQKFSY